MYFYHFSFPRYSTLNLAILRALCFLLCPPLLSSAWMALLSVQGVFDQDQVYLLLRGSLLHFYQVSSYFVFSRYSIVVRLYFLPGLRAFSGILHTSPQCMEASPHTLPH